LVRKRGRKLGKFNSSKIERNCEKVTKTLWIREGGIELVPTKLKKKANKCTLNRDRSCKQKNNAILKALVKAHLWKHQLEGGKGAIVRELSTKINISMRYMEEIIQ